MNAGVWLLPSTKSGFLCAFAVRNPHFRAFRAQNRGFCVINGDISLVLALPEHKIGIFVRFCPPKPPFSAISSTKSGFLCAFTLQSPRFRASRAQNRGFCALLPASFFPMAPSASSKPHSAEKRTPVWLAIWRIWAGFANSQLWRATFRSTYLYMCPSALLPL